MVKVRCSSRVGGAVSLNTKHRVWASYRVAGAADRPKLEVLLSSARLHDGRTVQFFLNRETKLIVVDVIDRNGKALKDPRRDVMGVKDESLERAFELRGRNDRIRVVCCLCLSGTHMRWTPALHPIDLAAGSIISNSINNLR